MSNHILLISYTFPPYPGIGGRRWAKFAKYLAKQGYIVHVICAKNPFNEKSLWNNDVLSDNIKIYDLDACYPSILLKQPNTIFDKINYRIALFYVKLFSKGTPYDKGIFWKKKLIDKSKELINKHNIKNLVVSCAPFSSAYQVLELKKEFKNINLIVDFRDPWTWGTGYGFSTLDSKRLQFEIEQEKQVMEIADFVLVPVEIMKKELCFKYPKSESKIKCLDHAFDIDEISINQNNKYKKIKIIFYGSLYKGIDNYFSILAQQLKFGEEKIELHIYSDSKRYSDIFGKENTLDKNVFYYSQLPTKKIFEKISESNFVLLIHPDYGINNIATKFYEIIYSRTPILYIGKEGLTSQFIQNNQLGYVFNNDTLNDSFKKIVSGNLPYAYNTTYDVSNYSFENTTLKFTQHFLVP